MISQAQRDVALDIPINFVTASSVSVTAACFANNTYEADAATKCISNLLAAGFKRLHLDLYWDQSQLYWSLCPAELPLPAAGGQPSSSITQSSTLTLLGGTVLSHGAIPTSRTAWPSGREANDGRDSTVLVHRRQNLDPSTFRAHTTIARSTDLPHAQPVPPNGIGSPGIVPVVQPGLQLYNVGPYACNTYANISTFLTLLKNHLDATDTTTQANLKQVLFNLHVASSSRDPVSPATAPSADRLPNGNNFIGGLAAAAVPSYIYSPRTLAQQRANLNISWSAAPAQDVPDPAYFTNATNAEHISVSPDGWPSEGFLEFFKTSRLTLGYGSVDPQLEGYNVQHDDDNVFPPGYLTHQLTPGFSSNGSVSSECIYEPNSPSLSAANSSFAMTSIDPVTLSSSNLISTAANSITACGISPHLNVTLSNTTADLNPAPYLAFALSTVWSWAPGQPLNDSAAASHSIPGMDDDDYSSTDFRCAYLNTSEALPSSGRWAVTFCQNRLGGACRSDTNPYAWTVSAQRAIYSSVIDNCPANSTFAVPRTPLENRYLVAAAQSHFANLSHSKRDDNDHNDKNLVWINFNSLDVEGCWVSGANSTCPYTPNAGQDEGQVVVPTVAALAFIVLAVLTILAKCGSNRRKSRKRRRIKGGWEYEGVPS